MVNTNKVKARIVELGKNQGDVAKHLGLAQPTFSQKINNLRPLDLDEALTLAKFLSIPVQEYGTYFFYDGVAQCNTAEEPGG